MTIQELVELYQKNRDFYLSAKYNETQLRSDFLDPMFELLGWDIKNSAGKPTNEREVILEESLRADVSENSKKPDYTFRLFSERKFFLEAKKPSISFEQNDNVARQVRRYGFTAKLKISIASNFEYLLIYDCSDKVTETDTSNKGLIDKIHFSEYVGRFDELKKYFGKDAVYSGDFDQEWIHIEEKIKLFSIDNLFLEQITEWRKILGDQIYKSAGDISEDQLNNHVQSYLNSIIFLRVCEDRNLEDYQTLLKMANEEDFEALLRKFIEADRKYNSGLFNQYLSKQIIEDVSSVFWQIIKYLYYPESPYSFSVFSSDILGNIYEIFLSEKLVIIDGRIELVKKPENEDRDVITTPNFIIQSILQETVATYCNKKSDEELLEIKIADISCGSGAFLLQTFQFVNDILIDYYLKNSPEKLIQTNVNTYKLPFQTKKLILIKCIFGNDKDYSAVQAAKFGLLLKLLEDEDNNTLPIQTSILPDLSNNIFYGNSLIETSNTNGMSHEKISQINPFIFSNAPFDVIIGNPPYMKSEDMKKFHASEYLLYSELYQSAYKQFDKYFLFIEKGMNLLKDGGHLGYIVPSKFMKIGAGKKLRAILSKNKYLFKIISFGANQVFEKRTTYTCLLFLRKEASSEVKFFEVKKIKEWLTKKVQEVNYETLPINHFSENNWILLNADLKVAYKKILDQSISLGDLAGSDNIFNGIQTSANDVYVIRPEKEDADFVYFSKDGTQYKIEKELTRPYFETSFGIDNLYTYREFFPNAKVIYPYKKDSDKIVFISIEDLENKYPFLFQYLNEFHDRLSERDIKPEPQSDSEWYRFGRHQSLDKLDMPIKLIVGVLSCGDKYSIDKHQTFISSGGTAGYCAVALPSQSPYSIYYIQAILNSKYAEWICTLIGDVFRGGYFAHGTAVLNKLPIKKIDFTVEKEVLVHNLINDLQKELIEIQSQIDKHTNNPQEKIKFERIFENTKNKLDDNLAQLYSLGEIDTQIPLIKNLYEID